MVGDMVIRVYQMAYTKLPDYPVILLLLGLAHFEVVVGLLGGLLPPNKITDPLQLRNF